MYNLFISLKTSVLFKAKRNIHIKISDNFLKNLFQHLDSIDINISKVKKPDYTSRWIFAFTVALDALSSLRNVSRDQLIENLRDVVFGLLMIALYICLAEGGELLIAKSPLSVKFQGEDPIDQNLIPEICSAAMGFTIQHEFDWQGMTITDPFNFAEVIVVLYVDGIASLEKSYNLQKYLLNNNEDEITTWRKLRNIIMERYPLENNTMVKLELGHAENLEEIKIQHLDKNVKEDAEFLGELVDLNKQMKKVKKSDGVPDLFWFNMKSLHQLSDLKGIYDPSTIEAKEMVYKSLLKLGKVYSTVYNDRALVIGLISDASHTRRTRSATDDKKESPNITDEVEDNIYDPDFPIIFNIILWFTVALFFSLLAVSVFIASMDPGRDSIIYRMTSNRMKKDS